MDSETGASSSNGALMVAAGAVVAETRETLEAFAVSASRQVHAMFHGAETSAERFYQAHEDTTVTNTEEARKKQRPSLEIMKVCEEAHADDVP